jgi:hypothetical protein
MSITSPSIAFAQHNGTGTTLYSKGYSINGAEFTEITASFETMAALEGMCGALESCAMCATSSDTPGYGKSACGTGLTLAVLPHCWDERTFARAR